MCVHWDIHATVDQKNIKHKHNKVHVNCSKKRIWTRLLRLLCSLTKRDTIMGYFIILKGERVHLIMAISAKFNSQVVRCLTNHCQQSRLTHQTKGK